MHIAGSKARCAALYQESTNAVIGTCPDDRQICDTPVGNPHLCTIEYERITVMPGNSAHTTRITSGIGFSQSKTSDYLALRHAWQPTLLLLLGTKCPDRKHG